MRGEESERDVGEVGDFLELALNGRERFESIKATIRRWKDPVLSARPERSTIGRAKAVETGGPRARESVLKIWMVAYDEPRSNNLRSRSARVRIESQYEVKGAPETGLVVIDRDQWWSYSPSDGAFHSDGRRSPAPGRSDIDRLFDPPTFKDFLTLVDLEVLGGENLAGRACVRARGVPQQGANIWSHHLAPGADAYDFLIDTERGVLLSISAILGGEPFEVSEVSEVSFDEVLGDELFIFTPPPGVEVGTAPKIAEHVTLEEAARRAPFKVLVPSDVLQSPPPDLQFIFSPERTHRGLKMAASLMLSCQSLPWFISQRATSDTTDDREWQSLEHSGSRLLTSEPGNLRGQRVVRISREGTTADLISELPLTEMADVAVTLIPAV
jgi:outer membrane lipoprotein-sorting protein